jgi:hypothetical protein
MQLCYTGGYRLTRRRDLGELLRIVSDTTQPHASAPFDERAALAELEQLADKIQRSRQQREKAVAEFDAFVKAFRYERYSASIAATDRELRRAEDRAPVPTATAAQAGRATAAASVTGTPAIAPAHAAAASASGAQAVADTQSAVSTPSASSSSAATAGPTGLAVHTPVPHALEAPAAEDTMPWKPSRRRRSGCPRFVPRM